ncbi:MAG: restriction endonuclease subunit S [Verrucomicrobiota bacterium]
MKVVGHWRLSALEDVAEIQTGLSKSASRQGASIRMPYLRVANVQDGHFDLTEIKEINVPSEAVERFRVRVGDVLLTEGGDFDKLGRGAVWNGQIPDCVHQNHIFVVRPNPEVLDTRFFAYQTQGPRGRAYFQSCSKQSTNLASINSSQLRQFPVALPPLPEQQKIVDILSAWDEALEKLDALIAAKERVGKVFAQEFFGMRHQGKWRYCKTTEVFRSRTERNGTGAPILSVTQDQGIVRRDTLERRIHADEINNGTYKLVYPGDYVISLRSFQGGLEYSQIFGAVSPAYHVITPRFKINGDFYRHYFKSYEFIGRLAVAIIGIRDGKQISFDDFAFMQLPIPSLEDQDSIGKILNICEAELRILRTQRSALDRQKRGLMQRLLTGKVRVKTP